LRHAGWHYRLKELVERYSPEVVESAIETIYRETEMRCRNVVGASRTAPIESLSVYDDDSVNPTSRSAFIRG
jgi:hypothetical protein